MQLTNNSLATTIGWVSSCLLASGVSTLFSESTRTMSMLWGSFGLAAAVGLDVTARVRERMRTDAMDVNTDKRFDRDMKYEAEAKEANADIRVAVTRLLGHAPPALQAKASRRSQERVPCDLAAELVPYQGFKGSAQDQDACPCQARVTNLSVSGFELLLAERLPHQRVTMKIDSASGGRQMMFGEVMWYGPPKEGSIVAGGRFLDAALVDGD